MVNSYYTPLKSDIDPSLHSTDEHDAFQLLKREGAGDKSWQYEEKLLSNRGVYNWFQIREAIRKDNTKLGFFDTIEDADVFDGNSSNQHTSVFMKNSVPRTMEYWRKRQREIAINNGVDSDKKPYSTPKMRLHYRINQPQSSFNTPKHKVNELRAKSESQELRAQDKVK
ncbi:TUB4 [Acrasis kona]|uniref:TUB4 n=1 Tax=Acrasis kona TaxID=1008807 RepID=A0AAW2ZKV6_9EUKA